MRLLGHIRLAALAALWTLGTALASVQSAQAAPTQVTDTDAGGPELDDAAYELDEPSLGGARAETRAGASAGALLLGPTQLADNSSGVPPSVAGQREEPIQQVDTPEARGMPEQLDPELSSDDERYMPDTIGGMPEEPTLYEYTSPLKRIGINIAVGSYGVSACIGLVYLVYVYPLQALFGDARIEPVMPWLLLPIAGPLLAQYEDSVKDNVGWRAVLIADAALQATGVLVALLGAALSGTRRRETEQANRLELHWGVAGASGVGMTGMTGLTVTWHTL